MYDSKPPVSKQKIFDITKAAMNAIRYFKHVVFCIEKFLVKVLKMICLFFKNVLVLVSK